MRVLTALYLLEIYRRYSLPCYAGSNGYNFHKSDISFALFLLSEFVTGYMIFVQKQKWMIYIALPDTASKITSPVKGKLALRTFVLRNTLLS